MQQSLPILVISRGAPAHLPVVAVACAASVLAGFSVAPVGFVICVGLICAMGLKIGAGIAWPLALLLALPLLACGYYGLGQLGSPLPPSAFGIGASGLW